jgi:hypothetical protein
MADENVQDLTVEILKQIRDEVRGTNAKLGGVEKRMENIQAEISTHRAETRRELMKINA